MASYVSQLAAMFQGLQVGAPAADTQTTTDPTDDASAIVPSSTSPTGRRTTTRPQYVPRQTTARPPYVPRQTFDMIKLSADPDMCAITETNATASHLLLLPAELRNQIFNHVLGGYNIHFLVGSQRTVNSRRTLASRYALTSRHMDRHIFEVRRSSDNAEVYYGEFASFLHLTLVCRQIYVETGLVPFVANTFVLTPTEDGDKWLAQKVMPAQQNAIQTVQCGLKELFYDTERRPLAAWPCTGTFRHLEGLKRLKLTTGMLRLTDREKEMVVEKIQAANGKDKLEVTFL